jgi:hypothetical protein
MTASITNIEKGAFLSLFNRGGYVLNFSTNDFDVFTQNSIGLALCNHYKKSKGKSLTAYVNEGSDDNVIKLFSDLLEYYEIHYLREIEGDAEFGFRAAEIKEYRPYYRKCREIMDRMKSNATPFTELGETLKERFSSAYISAQIDIMIKMQAENPTEAIGKAKELIESCCKTILEEGNISVDSCWSVSQLAKETMKFLDISTVQIDGTTVSGKIVKGILGSLQGIASQIAELRNLYGSGHGKSASYRGLTERHAKLAVGSSITLVNYLWDTFEWRQQSNQTP